MEQNIKLKSKYQPGDMVFATANPSVKLIIRRYVDRIYYCKTEQQPDSKDLAYFERELSDNISSIK